MAPSRWHDDARDAGHDEMQLCYFLLWKQRIEDSFVEFNGRRPIEVVAEFPIVSEKTGNLLAFVDVAVKFKGNDRVDAFDFWHLFELKPRIRSTGGLIRQIRATLVAANQTRLLAHGSQIFAVVYEDDPKLGELAAFGIPCVTMANADG